MTDLVLAGCAIFKDKSIILLHRKKTGWYELPGGKLEPKEDPKTGAIRELKEELGCDVEIIKKLGSKEFEEYGQNLLYHWFQARLKPGHDFQICEKEKFDHNCLSEASPEPGKDKTKDDEKDETNPL